MAERDIPCLDDREPPFPLLAFLAPKWRHIDESEPKKLVVARIAAPAGTEDETPPPRAVQAVSGDKFVYIGTGAQLVSAGLTIPFFGTLNHDLDYRIFLALPSLPDGTPNPFGRNRRGHPNEDVQQEIVLDAQGHPVMDGGFLGAFPHRRLRPSRDAAGRTIPLIECEICIDKKMAPAWFPPIGTQVKMYGHFVEDISHDQKTEIHPIHWLTWEQFRDDKEKTVWYRVTLLTDVSGRFPAEDIAARIDYPVDEIFPHIPKGQTITSEISHIEARQYENKVLQRGECRRVDDTKFQFTCTVGKWTGKAAKNCNTTEQENNDGGYWDGWVVFRLTAAPAAPGKTVKKPGIIYIGPAREDSDEPPRPSKPNIRIIVNETRRDENDGPVRVLRIAAHSAAPGYSPQRDGVGWTLFGGESSIRLPGRGLHIEAEVAIPLVQEGSGASAAGSEEESKEDVGLLTAELGDAGMSPMFLLVTITRDGLSESAFSVIEPEPLPEIEIDHTWSLRSYEPTRADHAASASYDLALSLRGALPPHHAPIEVHWQIIGGEPTEIARHRNAVARIAYSPQLQDRARVIRVEVYAADRRLFVGRKLIHVPSVQVQLVTHRRSGGSCEVTAQVSCAVGPAGIAWYVSPAEGHTVRWHADGVRLALDSEQGSLSGTRIFASATDAIGTFGYSAIVLD